MLEVIFSQNFEGSIVFWLPDELEVATEKPDVILTPNILYMICFDPSLYSSLNSSSNSKCPCVCVSLSLPGS